MDLDRRKSLERFHDRFVRQLFHFRKRSSFDKLGRHGARRDRRTAAERLELDVLDDFIFVDLQKHLHDVAALGVADGADAGRVRNLTDVSGMLKMIQNFFRILHYCTPPLG